MSRGTPARGTAIQPENPVHLASPPRRNPGNPTARLPYPRKRIRQMPGVFERDRSFGWEGEAPSEPTPQAGTAWVKTLNLRASAFLRETLFIEGRARAAAPERRDLCESVESADREFHWMVRCSLDRKWQGNQNAARARAKLWVLCSSTTLSRSMVVTRPWSTTTRPLMTV